MKSTLETKYLGKMAFESQIGNHKIHMDAAESVGGEDKGSRPKPLLLASIAGCTGMDVVSLLKKMRVEFDDFNIKIETEIAEEHPKKYTKIHVIYQFKGNNLPQDKLEKAVSLSQERYCGASATVKPAVELTYEIQVL